MPYIDHLHVRARMHATPKNVLKENAFLVKLNRKINFQTNIKIEKKKEKKNRKNKLNVKRIWCHVCISFHQNRVYYMYFYSIYIMKMNLFPGASIQETWIKNSSILERMYVQSHKLNWFAEIDKQSNTNMEYINHRFHKLFNKFIFISFVFRRLFLSVCHALRTYSLTLNVGKKNTDS